MGLGEVGWPGNLESLTHHPTDCVLRRTSCWWTRGYENRFEWLPLLCFWVKSCVRLCFGSIHPGVTLSYIYSGCFTLAQGKTSVNGSKPRSKRRLEVPSGSVGVLTVSGLQIQNLFRICWWHGKDFEHFLFYSLGLRGLCLVQELFHFCTQGRSEMVWKRL